MSTLVNIEHGTIQGQIKTSTLGTSYRSFTNIPYMKPPIGDLKFTDSQQPMPWTGTLDCTKEVESYCTYNSLLVLKTGKESAAVINVYVPNNGSGLFPILVNIHGGN
jgi:carboxylesterase type B